MCGARGQSPGITEVEAISAHRKGLMVDSNDALCNLSDAISLAHLLGFFWISIPRNTRNQGSFWLIASAANNVVTFNSTK